jgi:hypothetical protein
MIVFHAHVYNTFSEVKIFIHFVKTVVNTDFVILVKNSLDVCPRNLPIHDVTENNRSISTCTGYNSSIMTPRELHDRA